MNGYVEKKLGKRYFNIGVERVCVCVCVREIERLKG